MTRLRRPKAAGICAARRPQGGWVQGRGPLRATCHPISLVLPKETGVAPQRKTLWCRPERFLRVFTGFQLSKVVIPVSNEFSAPPTVRCSLRSRHYLAGFHQLAARAKRSQPRSAAGKAIRRRDDHLKVSHHSNLRADLTHRPAPKRFSLWSLRGFFLTRQKEISQNWAAGTFVPAPPSLRAGRRQAPAAVGRHSLVRSSGWGGRARGRRRGR